MDVARDDYENLSEHRGSEVRTEYPAAVNSARRGDAHSPVRGRDTTNRYHVGVDVVEG